MTLIVGTNSLVSVVDADLYMANRLYADAWPQLAVDPREPDSADEWIEPTEENAAKLLQKEKALQMATQALNSQRYIGRVVTYDQPLAWPRYGVCDREGRHLPTDLIPSSVKAATCELALILIRCDLTNDSIRRDLYRTTGQQIGSTSASYQRHAGVELPTIVIDLLGQFLESQCSLPVRP